MLESTPKNSAWYSRVHWGLIVALAVGLIMEMIGTSTLIGSGAADQVGPAGFAVALMGFALAPLVLLGLWLPWVGGAALLADAVLFSLALWEMHGWKIAGRVGLPVLAMVALVTGTSVVRHGWRGLTQSSSGSEARATLIAACVFLAAYSGLLFLAMPQEPAILLMPSLALAVGVWRPQVGTALGFVLVAVAHFLRAGSPVPELVATAALYWPLAAIALFLGLVWVVKRADTKETDTVTH